MSEDMEYVKEFITKMNTQDNRSTATPFYYQIRDYEWVCSYHKGEGDRVNIVYDTESYTGETLVEAFSNFIENGYAEDFDRDKEDEWEIEDYLDGLEYINGIYWEVRKEKFTGVFFTETDAKEHLRLNHYHYSSDADTYVNHAWRAPELEQFFKSVGKICGVELKQK